MTKVVGVSFGTKDGRNDAFCKEALMGAREEGCEVEFIHAMDLDIRHCTGCQSCVFAQCAGRGNPCIHKDDFDWLMTELFHADGVLFVDPIFENGCSGLFKTVCDRFGPRTDTGMCRMAQETAEKNKAEGKPYRDIDPAILNPRVCVSFIAMGGSEWGTSAQADHQMQAMSPSWKMIDNEWVPWSQKALVDDEVIARAHQAGVNLARAAKDFDTATTLARGACPHCQNNNFYLWPGTNKVTCTVCGLDGHIAFDEKGNVEVHYTHEETHDERGLFRAHDTDEGKQIHGEDINRMYAEIGPLMQDERLKARRAAYKAFVSPAYPPYYVDGKRPSK